MSLRSDVKAYPDEYLPCRYPVHAFNAVRWYHVGSGRTGTRAVVLECRCGMTAIDTLDAAGNRMRARRYIAPEGYYLTGYGRIDRAEFRREVMNRLGPPSGDGET